MQAIEIRDPELERRFEAFARLRLSPDASAVARIRARVMREARLQHEAARIAAYVAPVVDARRRSASRRVAMPLLAAAAWTAIAVGTIAAAQPGGGLYPARLWVEQAILPAAGNARVDADLRRLDDRIVEALAAANRGDRAALAAALDAYGASAEDATTTSEGNPALSARVGEALGRHQAVLSALVAGFTADGNDNAAAAIERNLLRAIDQNAAVLDTLATHQGGGVSNGGGAVVGGGPGGGGGSGTGTDQGAGAPNGNGGGGSGGASTGGGSTGGEATGGGNGSGGGGGHGGGGAGPTDAHPTPAPAGTQAPEHTPRGDGG